MPHEWRWPLTHFWKTKAQDIFAAAASEAEVNERGTSLNARNCGYAQVEDLGCARVVVMREWEDLGCAAYQSHV